MDVLKTCSSTDFNRSDRSKDERRNNLASHEGVQVVFEDPSCVEDRTHEGSEMICFGSRSASVFLRFYIKQSIRHWSALVLKHRGLHGNPPDGPGVGRVMVLTFLRSIVQYRDLHIPAYVSCGITVVDMSKDGGRR